MIRIASIALVIALPLTLAAAPPSAAEDLPLATRWIPSEAVIVLEVPRPGPLLDPLLDPRLGDVVKSTDAYRKAAEGQGFKDLLGLVALVEGRTGADWRTAVRKAFGGGLTFAAMPDGATILSVDAEDPKVLEEMHGILADIARSEASKRGGGDPVKSTERKGVTAWSFGPNEHHAILGKRILLANRTAALEAVLALREAGGDRCLESSPALAAARKAAGGSACARLFVDLEALKRHPAVLKGLEGKREPLGSLLLAGVLDALRASSWLSIGARVDGGRMVLEAATDRAGDASGAAAFSVPPDPGLGALPHLAVPRRIAALSLYRDLHGFYAAKDKLFPERTAGLIFFENMMGIFFSGLDLTEEVFAELGPEVRVVVAEQEYDPAVGTPRVRVPGFAAVFRLRNPEKFGEVMEEAWQKALGLINFTRGQQALPGLIIDRPAHEGTRFSIAYFRPPKEGERKDIDIRFNFRPALARAGDSLILSSTEGLARDLMAVLAKESAAARKPVAGTHSLLDLDGPGLLSIVRENRENMVLNNMVEKGNSREKAEGEIDLLLLGLEAFRDLHLSIGAGGDRPRASLDLRLQLPREAGHDR